MFLTNAFFLFSSPYVNAIISNMRLTGPCMSESVKAKFDTDFPIECIFMDSVINQMLITVSP